MTLAACPGGIQKHVFGKGYVCGLCGRRHETGYRAEEIGGMALPEDMHVMEMDRIERGRDAQKATPGWAVRQRGQIDAATVAATRRGAIVNWLCTHGIPVFNFQTDEDIEALWISMGGGVKTALANAYPEVIEVLIDPAK